MSTVRSSLVISANSLRRADLHTRLRAAGEAGFDSVGLRVNDFVSAIEREGHREAALMPLLESTGVAVFEVEAAWDWTDTSSADHKRMVDLLKRMRDTLDFQQFNAFIFHDVSPTDAARGYEHLCATFPDITVGLEHIPYGPIRTLREATETVRNVAAPNGRIILDSWHFARSQSTWASLLDVIPPEVCSIQLSDVHAAPHADLSDEARHDRLPPGEGHGDLKRWYSTLLSKGIRRPTSIEVVNDEQDALPPADIARKLYRCLTGLIAASATSATVEARLRG